MKMFELKILHIILIAILLVTLLEIIAISQGLNGTCMRTAVTTIGALAGVGGGWGLRALISKK